MTDSPPPTATSTRYKKFITSMIYILIGLFLFMLVRGLMSRFNSPTSTTIPDQLAPCPNSPNCVCSQDETTGHQIEALDVPSHITDPISIARNILQQMPRTKITLDTNNYLRAESTSLFLRYVDDIEILWDPADQKLQLRSASRVGYSDFGVNRNRLENLRLTWNELTKVPQK